MENFKKIIINKNRGWRGLSSVEIVDDDYKKHLTYIFSFSQQVWDDMLGGHIVVQDENYYYILTFDNTARLPAPTQQRSVLIKDFIATVLNVNRYEKATWKDKCDVTDYTYIYYFNKNRNNHTQSNWNCIGLRVMPII